MLKRLWRSKPVQAAMGSLLAGYLRLVQRTNRLVLADPAAYAWLKTQEPYILAMWHGQHFMIPIGKTPDQRYSVLISRHGDGEMNAIAVTKFGIDLIRGSGAQRADQVRKRGGVKALLAMLDVLRRGENMVLTADVPKISRVCGRGIITLAQKSGRPIIPIALVCSRRFDLKSWDRTSIGAPFGTAALALGPAISVAADADDAALEVARQRVEEELDRAHAVAYGLIDDHDPGAGRADVAAARLAARQDAAHETGQEIS